MHSPLNKIKLIVKEKIGLDSSTIGDSTIEKIIQQRMHKCKMDDFENYYQLVNDNREELSELLEVVVIPETWFFRDIRPFEIIYKKIKQQITENKTGIFKILSIPSSTGEEPYSLAMYLIDKGIDAARFTIDAVDISCRALKCAEQGVYGNNSFRGKHYHEYQQRHFEKEGDFYKINSNIKNKVKFYRLNILQGDPTLKLKFDFILCRNLLIYFDIPTKLIAFKNLSNFLKDSGYLFIGHSEFGSVPDIFFQNTGFEKAFALIKPGHPDYRKKETEKTTKTTPSSDKKQTPIAKPFKQKKAFESLIKKEKPTASKDTINNAEDVLKKIRKLADSANYDEAENICRQLINDNGEDVESLFLLGLINSSQNKTKIAEPLFRKGLFLDPKHYESLIHLSLLLQEAGDSKNAELLKRRAENSLINKKV